MKKYFGKIKLVLNFILFPMILVGVLNCYFNFMNNGSYRFDFRPMAFVLACIIVSIVYYIFIFLTGKTKYGVLGTSILFFVIYFVSQLKIIYTNNPLYLSDFVFINKVSNLTEIVGNTLFDTIGKIGFCSICVLVFLIFIFIDSMIINIKFNLKKRVCFFVLDVFLLLLLFVPNKYTCELYSDIFFNDNDRTAYETYTTYDSYYNTYGTIAGMYGVYLENLVFEPDDYDERVVNEILDGDVVDNNNSLGTPNIIVLLGESFWNINKLEGITFDKDVIGIYNDLKKDGYYSNLVVPTYGGLTANSVFQFLTGSNISYYSNGYIPFMQSYNDDRAYDYPCIIKDLKNNNYISYAMFGMDSYNFGNVFEKMGFDYYGKYPYSFSDVKGQYVSDDYTVRQIINTFNGKRANDNYFYLAFTTQNHMPYSYDRYYEYDIRIESSSYSEEENGVILSYAQGLYDTASSLNKLYEYINTLDEDTLIIFFGDHLPYLKTKDGVDIIDKSIDDIVDKYTTEALILSNYDIDLDMPDSIGIDLLLNYIINNMDVELSNYYKWMYDSIFELNGYNRYFFSNDGESYSLSDIDNIEEEVYNLREGLQYKLFYKK